MVVPRLRLWLRVAATTGFSSIGVANPSKMNVLHLFTYLLCSRLFLGMESSKGGYCHHGTVENKDV